MTLNILIKKNTTTKYEFNLTLKVDVNKIKVDLN